jgi:hypothetical protein
VAGAGAGAGTIRAAGAGVTPESVAGRGDIHHAATATANALAIMINQRDARDWDATGISRDLLRRFL